MSAKRRLRRQQSKGKKPGAPPRPGPSREDARRQTEAERFKTPGSDKLWLALRGLSSVERDRAWLLQAIHDAAQRRQSEGDPDAARAIAQLAARSPSAAAGLDTDSVETATELWAADGDEYSPGDPSPRWEYLANLCRRLDLGAPSANDLQEEWEAFTGLVLASVPRRALMQALATSEQAALELDAIARSDNVKAVANVIRILWSALAYGDEDTFERLKSFSSDWLARADSVKRP